MDDTPLAHVVVDADATYWTGEVTVVPDFGLVTVTVANKGIANDRNIGRAQREIFMVVPQQIRHETLNLGKEK